MSFKRALVVDDSQSARISLRRLLEQHDLAVDEAVSGEEALDFLKDHAVDVIFMDHTMPGMDGLEAVSAIKSNPRTATIPVMMYTTQEGEVYVGQARALGAVDVLPKQVEPRHLFEMLLKLGLVTDRRMGDEPADTAEPPPGGADDDIDRQYEQQALGMSVQALVTRILEDQHLKLRSDILQSHRDFAKQVAGEVLKNQPPATPVTETMTTPLPGRQSLSAGWIILMIVPIVLLCILYWQSQNDLTMTLARVETLESQLTAAQSTHTAAVQPIVQAPKQADLEYLHAVEWAINQGSHLPFDEQPFDEKQIEILGELLTNLTRVGFTGTVRLESHLGEFCLATDDSGSYTLADPDVPVEACTRLGHPLDDSTFVSDRQTIGFANFLATTALLKNSGIDVELIAHDRQSSTALHETPPATQTAGQWNRIAELNNRIVYSLIPST